VQSKYDEPRLYCNGDTELITKVILMCHIIEKNIQLNLVMSKLAYLKFRLSRKRPSPYFHGLLALLNSCQVFVISSVSPLQYNLGSSYLLCTL
jgi:hypothetical protein